MKYTVVPRQINVKDFADNDFSFSPSRYKKIDCPNPSTKTLGDLLTRHLKASDKGVEIGSNSYITKSPRWFIRTKSLQSDSFLPYFRNDSVVPILPNSFIDYNLLEGDVLISKDSNIGESVILDQDYPNYMISGGIYRLPLGVNKKYIFAFLKHDFFKNQLDFLTSRGATIRHAKTLFLDCIIPFPNQKNSNYVIDYVESLVDSICLKEKTIRQKDSEIFNLINDEIENNQKLGQFQYTTPNIKDILEKGRLDSSLYIEDFQHKEFLVRNYKHGSEDLVSRNFKWARGTSLEIQGLGTRVDSDTFKEGYLELIIPTNITEFGTVSKSTFIGTSKKLKTIKRGDIIFGGEGFGKGRTFVVCDETSNIATNYHGIRIFKDNPDITEAIFIRCFLSYWRSLGMIDYIGVGGSGGHCAPQYFDLIEIPNFPEGLQSKIAKLYLNLPTTSDFRPSNLDDIKHLDEEWSKEAGIIELDSSVKNLRGHLGSVLGKIIADQEVSADLNQFFIS